MSGSTGARASGSALDTPMMRQYLAVKAQHPDAIVFYRMGDFYEMFLRDAEVCAPLLDIALTTRDKGKPDAVPMCGVPVHAADQYLARLAAQGLRVAICEQVEEAGAARKLVKREVVEVVTPGLVGDPDRLEGGRELALCALAPGPEFGMAVLDASTGDLRATRAPAGQGGVLPAAIRDELRRIEPRELLLPKGAEELAAVLARELPGAVRSEVDPASYAPSTAPVHPSGLARDAQDPASRAAAALLAYLSANQPIARAQVSQLRHYGLGDTMLLDVATRAHLELFRNGEDGTRARTLIERIDATVTALGARRLARWLAYPLLDPATIAERQDAVAWLASRDRARARLREALRPVRDLERLLAKTARPSAVPRDLAQLRASVEALPGVAASLAARDEESLDAAPRAQALLLPQPRPELAQFLREALVDEPPALPRGSRGAHETGFIREGFHAELDGLREAARKGREWIAGLESSERERTGISGLRIRHHPVHGYGIEISKSKQQGLPADYERKQTLANAERYATPALREMEERVRGATSRAAALEREILERVRREALTHAEALGQAADAVADLDAFASLAEVARRDGWIRPQVDASAVLRIRGGRHAVVEPLLQARGEGFVANDTELDPASRQMLVLTGPNMSGKSTYLRQVALCVLLAQIGSCVPAESAHVGIVDRVFTRIGASDRLARGESTFMVEMRETAEIVAQATSRSLIILDEIGRGTSTFDGLSIAWAVAEHLHDLPGGGPRTLFATHYHELTDLALEKERVVNAHFEAREWGEQVLFLRRLVEGGASRSYGIQVAKLAGLPDALIARAREILRNLEGGELDERGHARLARGAAPGSAAPAPATAQLGLFEAPEARAAREVLEALRAQDAERTTPLDALALIARWQARLRGEDA
jgi:DNA mismatch repair protein MutS